MKSPYTPDLSDIPHTFVPTRFSMTADEKKHEKRCETCSKIGMPLCPISKYLDRYSTTKDIIPILTMIVGCASHSSNQITPASGYLLITPKELTQVEQDCIHPDLPCSTRCPQYDAETGCKVNAHDVADRVRARSNNLTEKSNSSFDDDPLTAAYLKGKEDGRKEVEQRIADAIKELERRKYLSIDVTIDEAISLLQVKK